MRIKHKAAQLGLCAVLFIQCQPFWLIRIRSRDSSHTYLHHSTPLTADLFEDFSRTPLAPEDIYVPPERQPLNPEDEDDVVPDQHAAFGIQRATQKARQPAWRDLGLEELMRRGPAREESVGRALVERSRWGANGVREGSGSGLPR
ncbi:Apc13p-domain-containing protein [Saccharata proteae CBS 121410]|uniref:Apc13p-domain-containing protein n=1 Tax=Saccharata proteae CBS 121410 TaxID=1314787 RepID=A0A9P4LZC5_9PEZI|nr:Apc13p-domain-containing protein [Saccharata proteae CBS 121410]